MRIPKKYSLAMGLITTIVATLTACGGGGGGSSPSSLTTTVMDGLVSNALVCVDANSNNVCDAGEIQGRTDASGKVTLQLNGANVSNAKLIAVIGTDAIDADTGPITTAYTLQTPIAKSDVISPLTTMVQTKMDADNVNVSDAELYVKTQTGLTVSVFDNFIAMRGQNADYQKAAEVSRLLVLSTQQSLNQTTTTTVGLVCSTQGSATTTLTPVDISKEKIIRQNLLVKLADISSSVASNTVKSACSNGVINALCDTAIKTQITLVSTCTPSTPSTTTTNTVTTGTGTTTVSTGTQTTSTTAGGTTTTGTTTTSTGTKTTTTTGGTTGTGTTSTTSTGTSTGTTTGTTTGTKTTTTTGGTTSTGTTTSTTSTGTSTGTTTPTTSGANGKVVYGTYCAMCHGSNPASNSNKILNGANAPTVITNAINGNTGGMGFLKGTITAQQASDLATYLAKPASF